MITNKLSNWPFLNFIVYILSYNVIVFYVDHFGFCIVKFCIKYLCFKNSNNMADYGSLVDLGVFIGPCFHALLVNFYIFSCGTLAKKTLPNSEG